MKAIQFNERGGPEVLQLVELPKPEPGSGQVLIKVSRPKTFVIAQLTVKGSGIFSRFLSN